MVSRLLKTGEKFKTKFKKVGGGEFYGQLLDLPDTSRVSNFLSPRRYLRVSSKSSIKPTDVIIADGVKFIVGEHGTGFHFAPIYIHYKLFQVDVEAQWYRNSVEEDIVTGQEKTVRTLQQETVYLSTQPKALIEDDIHIQQQTYVAISNLRVGRNDIVDNKIVTRVDDVLGLYLIEMKEQ